MSANSIYVDITTQAGHIGISKDNTNWNWIYKRDLSVNQLYNPNPNYPTNYRYPTATIIILKDTSGHVKAEFELQDVKSHNTWSTGLQSGLTAGANDIATWISTP